MHVTLMHNPKAGDEGPAPGEIEDALRREGYEVRSTSTKEDDYESALEDSGGLVVIAGGDGTVEKVALRLVGRGVPIGILPLGTANNIATSLGVEGSFRDIISNWDLERRKAFDVGFVRSPWGEGHFMEGVGLGLLSSAIVAADAGEVSDANGSAWRKLVASSRLISQILPSHTGSPYEIVIDGTSISDDYLFVEVMNTGWIGPNLHLGPGSDTGDGLFELVFAKPDDRERLSQFFGNHKPRSHSVPPISILRGRQIEIRWSGAKLHVDDEIWPEEDSDPDRAPAAATPERLTIEVKPGALEFLIP